MMDFSVACGSVPGTDHTKPGQPGWRNNQDAAACIESDKFVVAVVCDGCGSGVNNEVGAKLGARLIANSIAKTVMRLLVSEWELTEYFWNRISKQVVAQLSVIADAMGGSLSKTVNDYFLFAFVGVLVMPERTYVFSLGDGVYAINGRVETLGPFPNNSPPYLMYNLTGSSLLREDGKQLCIKVNEILPTSELESCLIGSDGVIELINQAESPMPLQGEPIGLLSQFWTNPQYMKNPDAIRRRLALINIEYASGNRIHKGPLRDDTTIAVVNRVIRRVEGGIKC